MLVNGLDSQSETVNQNVVTVNVSGAVGDAILELTRDTEESAMVTLSELINDTRPTQMTFTISNSSLQALADGAYTLTITATDDAGNSEYDTKALIINRDVTVQNQFLLPVVIPMLLPFPV